MIAATATTTRTAPQQPTTNHLADCAADNKALHLTNQSSNADRAPNHTLIKRARKIAKKKLILFLLLGLIVLPTVAGASVFDPIIDPIKKVVTPIYSKVSDKLSQTVTHIIYQSTGAGNNINSTAVQTIAGNSAVSINSATPNPQQFSQTFVRQTATQQTAARVPFDPAQAINALTNSQTPDLLPLLQAELWLADGLADNANTDYRDNADSRADDGDYVNDRLNDGLVSLNNPNASLAQKKQRAALILYKHEALKDNATAVFERALKLSMQLERASDALEFAKRWQAANPDHVPALFYVAHLAVIAHDYPTVADSLNKILAFDKNADLTQLFAGILPDELSAQRALAQELQGVNADDNASLGVLKAGLLARLGETRAAILYVDSALNKDPNNWAYLMLKADILKQSADTNADGKRDLLAFLDATMARVASNNPTIYKQLLLYKAHYLINAHALAAALDALLPHATATADPDTAFLAALLAIDLGHYDTAKQLFGALQNSTKSAAAELADVPYYLGVIAEREFDPELAAHYFAQVKDGEFLLPARKKLVEFYTLAHDWTAAANAAAQLRTLSMFYAEDSYLLQARALLAGDQTADARQLLQQAHNEYPDDPDILALLAAQTPDDTDQNAAQKLSYYRTLAENAPENPEFVLPFAQLLARLSPNDPVLRELTAHDAPEIKAFAYTLLADKAEQAGDSTAAIAWLSKALAISDAAARGPIRARLVGLGAQIMEDDVEGSNMQSSGAETGGAEITEISNTHLGG